MWLLDDSRDKTKQISCIASSVKSVLCCVIVYKTARLRNKHAEESRAPMEHYSNFQRIGEGSYGEVYKAQDEKGRLVAVKKCRFKVSVGRVGGCAVSCDGIELV